MNTSGRNAWRLALGANPLPAGGCAFRVWGPACRSLAILPEGGGDRLPLQRDDHGYWEGVSPTLSSGDRYSLLVDGDRRIPDPVSRLLPQGVHGPTEIVDPDAWVWRDHDWRGITWPALVFYEAHVGTASGAGSFDSLIDRLPYLADLGITCLELMPVAQFPGKRNWGYDGVGLYAVQESYGGPEGLKRLVDAAHGHGLAVCLDVVYNHFGPEGNYLQLLGPYFTDLYRTPWGDALNFDGPGSDHVRRFLLDNARYWFGEYHIDALRLDAIHGLYDHQAIHILTELAALADTITRESGVPRHLVAESNLNDPRLLHPPDKGGYGVHGQWCDDLHHAFHVLLTSEQAGYYKDYRGLPDLEKVLRQGFLFDGIYSKYSERRHGAPPEGIDCSRFVFALQNHDQIGNRATGDRLAEKIPGEALQACAALQILSPMLPLLFMGEEYGETAPFQFFIDHGDPQLREAVRRGRAAEFPEFQGGSIPDPADPQVMERSRPDWHRAETGGGLAWLAWYRGLLALRRRLRPDNYGAPDARRVQVDSGTGLVRIDYGIGPIPDFRLVVLLSGKGSTLDEAAPGGGTILMERGVTRTARVLELAPWAVLLIRPAQQEDQTAR